MKRRLTVLGAVFALSALGGCAATAPPEPAGSTAVSAPTSASTRPSAAASDAALPDSCYWVKGSVLLASSAFALAEASRGQRDHRSMVSNLVDSSKQLSDDATKDGCSAIVVPASHLAMEAAIINASVAASGEASDDDYKQAQKAGQELADAAGVDITFGEGD